MKYEKSRHRPKFCNPPVNHQSINQSAWLVDWLSVDSTRRRYNKSFTPVFFYPQVSPDWSAVATSLQMPPWFSRFAFNKNVPCSCQAFSLVHCVVRGTQGTLVVAEQAIILHMSWVHFSDMLSPIYWSMWHVETFGVLQPYILGYTIRWIAVEWYSARPYEVSIQRKPIHSGGSVSDRCVYVYCWRIAMGS